MVVLFFAAVIFGFELLAVLIYAILAAVEKVKGIEE